MQSLLDFASDIIRDPSEYLPMFLALGFVVTVWSLLILLAIVAWRTDRTRRRFRFAILVTVLSLLLFKARITASMSSNGNSTTIDFSWAFLVPLILGGIVLLKCGWARFGKARPAVTEVHGE